MSSIAARHLFCGGKESIAHCPSEQQYQRG
jgi:hypothetical protein